MRELLRLAREVFLSRASAPAETVTPPRYRVERIGSRLSDVCPTPGELKATDELLEATRALLERSTTTTERTRT
jgi:hypothetical protein